MDYCQKNRFELMSTTQETILMLQETKVVASLVDEDKDLKEVGLID
jgi:hypothetical protein